MKHWIGIFLLVSIIWLPSCSHNSTSVRIKKATISRSTKESKITLQEAKYSDIPSPINALPLVHYYHATEQGAQFGYRDRTRSIDDVATFYLHEMERLGWRTIFDFSGKERLLLFDKPERIAIISLHSTPSKQTEWIITTGLATSDE